MVKWRKILQVALIFMLVLSLATEGRAACDKEQPSGSTVELAILSINDFHGALTEAGRNPGIAKLGTYIMEEKRRNPEGTLVLSAGDMFQGSPESNMLHGKTVVEAMNEIGFDAMVVGNHEFDWGVETLKRQIAQSGFPYLGANVLDKRTRKPVKFLKPYVILKKNGIRVAVIGIATPETAYKSAPKVVGDFIFADPAKTVRELVPALRKKAEVIVVLSHLGCEADEKTGEIRGEAADFARAVQGVDLIITGHSHQRIVGKVNEIPLVQAGEYGRTVGKANFTYSAAAKGITFSITSLTDLPTPGLLANPRLAELLEQAQGEIAPLKNTVLGRTPWELSHDRSRLSLLGQWSADVMRTAVKADIAFLNGGGLRTSIQAGEITVGKMYEVMPFDNTLYVIELNGKQVMDVLQHGIKNHKVGMLQFSGLRVHYDAAMPAGERITATMADGTPLVLDRLYKVVTNDFMAAGGDEYNTFKEGKNGFDTHIPLREELMKALKKQQLLRYEGDNRFTEAGAAYKKAA